MVISCLRKKTCKLKPLNRISYIPYHIQIVQNMFLWVRNLLFFCIFLHFNPVQSTLVSLRQHSCMRCSLSGSVLRQYVYVCCVIQACGPRSGMMECVRSPPSHPYSSPRNICERSCSTPPHSRVTASPRSVHLRTQG